VKQRVQVFAEGATLQELSTHIKTKKIIGKNSSSSKKERRVREPESLVALHIARKRDSNQQVDLELLPNGLQNYCQEEKISIEVNLFRHGDSTK
jgi:hypothetical protein